jgi:WD40 repeat protein
MALWEVTRGQRVKSFTNHTDRVTTAAVSPDGLWLLSGARDGELKLWDFHSHQEARSCKLAGEIRACFFLLDGATLLAIDAAGRITLHKLPELEIEGELTTGLRVQSAALAPSGEQIALGDEDGHLRLVALEDFDQAALFVTATRMSRRKASKWQRLLGRTQVVDTYQCTCPICRQSFELPGQEHNQPTACPNCRRTLKVSSLVASGQDS